MSTKKEDRKSEERRKPEERKLHDVGISDVTTPSAAPARSAPVRSAAVAPVKPKPLTNETVTALPKITLDVYLLAKGVRPDQTAGFRRWMKSRKVRRQTMPEWEVVWTEFQTRPITNRR